MKKIYAIHPVFGSYEVVRVVRKIDAQHVEVEIVEPGAITGTRMGETFVVARTISIDE